MSAIFHSLNSLDFLLIGTWAVFVFAGFMRGFARTLAGIIGVLISVIGALVCTGFLSPMAAAFVRRLLVQGLAQHLSFSSDMLDQIAGAVVAVMQTSLLRTVVFSLCYLIFITLWLYACNYLGVLARFNSLKKLDQVAGAVIGGAKGAVVLCVIVFALGQFQILPESVMDASLFVSKVSAFVEALIG